MSKITLIEQASAPSTPSAGQVSIYIDQASARLATKDDGGTVVKYGASSFDATVAPSGGDYTSIAAAFNAGHKTVFVNSGTYVESSDILIPEDGGLVGEAAGSVIIVLTSGAKIKIDGSARFVTGGTLAINNGSTSVTGTGTTFTSLLVGDYIDLNGVWHEIATITSNTALTVLRTYRGRNVSGYVSTGQSMIKGASLINIVVANATTRAIEITQAAHVVFMNSLLVNCGEAGEGAIRVYRSYGVSVNNVVVEDAVAHGIVIDFSRAVRFEATACRNCNGNGFYLKSKTRVAIFDTCVSVQNQSDGWQIGDGTVDDSPSEVLITDSQSLQNNGIGIDIAAQSTQVVVDSTLACGNGSHGINVQATATVVQSCMVKQNGGTGVVMAGYSTVGGCYVNNSTSHGIDCTGAADFIVEGCRVGQNGGHGVIAGNNGIIGNCRIVGQTGGDGIHCPSGAVDNVIDGNRSSGNSSNGIELVSGANNNIVTSNNFKGNTGTNLVNSGTGNTLDNNLTA